MPPFIYAYDRKQNWVLHFLAQQEFTVSEIDEYTIERRDRREDMVKHTILNGELNRQPPSFNRRLAYGGLCTLHLLLVGISKRVG
jgi:hypothetical protein